MATETSKEIRKGIKLYIDYFENEFEDLTNEELGIIIRALYQYDQFQKVDEKYSEIINKDRTLKAVFKTISKNNDFAVAEWNRKREYYAKKDKQKKIREIMKSEDVSYEEALSIYEFENNEIPTIKTNNEPQKNNLEEIVYETAYGSFKTKVFKDNIRNALSQNQEDIETLIDELEYEVGENKVKDVLQKIFDEAEKDFYKLQFYEYVNKVERTKGE